MTTPKTKTPPRSDDTGVRRQYFEAAPNKMFSELNRACIRFVRYEEKVPCALCKQQKKRHWTCVVRFKAADFSKSAFKLDLGKKWLDAGAPVCTDHPLHPDEHEFMRQVRAQRKIQAAEVSTRQSTANARVRSGAKKAEVQP